MSSIVYLIGPPAVGKRTIGARLAERTGAILVDNQTVNLPIFTLLRWDGSPIPPAVWTYIEPIRQSIWAALRDIAPRALSYVLTNVLDSSEQSYIDDLAAIAVARGSVFLPVFLHCDTEEQIRRVGNADRHARMKLVDPDDTRTFLATTEFLEPGDPDALRIDTTSRPPDESVDLILRRLAGMQPPAAGNVTEEG